MMRARAIAASIFILTASSFHQTALAQRGSAIDTLAAQMTAAGQAGRQAEALALAQKLEGLVRRQQGTDNMNYAGVLHNEGMFLQNLGRYQEAVEKLNSALAIKLRHNDPASTLRTSNILIASLAMLDRRADASAVAERALTIGTQAFGPDDVRLAGTLAALGGLAPRSGELQRCSSVISNARSRAGKDRRIRRLSRSRSSMDDLGDLYGLQGRFDDGERLLKQALQLLEQSLRRQRPDRAELRQDPERSRQSLQGRRALPGSGDDVRPRARSRARHARRRPSQCRGGDG